MKYKLLFAGDLHKYYKDKTTIKGYVNTCTKVEEELLDIIKREEITHFISLGDWFDKGYGSDIAATLADYDLDIELSKLVNGNFYGVIGNHIRLNMDSNPELHLIQPHRYYKTRRPTSRTEQIIKTPDYLMLNGVQISFAHYNSKEESAYDYKLLRQPEAKYHIGVYHTHQVIPTAALKRVFPNITTNSDAIKTCLDNVDFAIVGHIHKPLGAFRINSSNGHTCTMMVPGSLTNTDAGEGSRHDSIKVPIIEISEDSTVNIRLIDIDLYTDNLTFLRKGVDDDTKMKLRALRGNNLNTLYEGLENAIFSTDGDLGALSLNAFMAQQQYTREDKLLIRNILDQPENINALHDIYNGSKINL